MKIVDVRPGDAPFQRLAEKLAALREGTTPDEVLAWLRRSDDGLFAAVNKQRGDDDTHVLVFIDRFEELFGFRREGHTGLQGCRTAHRATKRRRSWLCCWRRPARPSGGCSIILTMQYDFVGDCEVFLGLPQAVSRNQFLVPQLTRQTRWKPITRPSRSRRTEFPPFSFEPGLVDTLINEAGDRPDQLPLLQHALMRTWKTTTQAADRSWLRQDRPHRTVVVKRL